MMQLLSRKSPMHTDLTYDEESRIVKKILVTGRFSKADVLSREAERGGKRLCEDIQRKSFWERTSWPVVIRAGKPGLRSVKRYRGAAFAV